MVKLYKFHAVNKFSLSALARGQIWAAKPASFNDPFDCRASVMSLRRAIVARQYLGGREFRVNVMGSTTSALSPAQRERVESMGVYSMSRVKTHRLMWSHYADHFRGFCVEYTFDKEAYDEQCVKVVYEKSIPAARGSTGLLKHVAKYKAPEWGYEREYRLVYEHGDCYYPRPAEITGVIFAPLCPESDEETIMQLLPGVRASYLHLEDDLSLSIRQLPQRLVPKDDEEETTE